MSCHPLVILSAACTLALSACGPVRVTYNLACVASCGSTGANSNIASSACETDGQDPTAIAAANVSACMTSARNAGCPDPTCACQAERTTTLCN